MFQMKEQDKTPEELNEVEIANQVKGNDCTMIKEFRRIDEQSKKLEIQRDKQNEETEE